MKRRFAVFLILVALLLPLVTACPQSSTTTTNAPQSTDINSTASQATSGTTTSPPSQTGTTSTATSAPEPSPTESFHEVQGESVWLLNELNYGLDLVIGKKVWVLGIFGDASISSDGLAYLVENFQTLLVNEVLPEHRFARMRGELPDRDKNGAEILVYGEVQDYAVAMNDASSPPVPLITVEKYDIITEPKESDSWENPFEFIVSLFKNLFKSRTALADEEVIANTAGPGDRALIINGGVDNHNAYAHYQDDVLLKYQTLLGLNFAAGQIHVSSTDGSAINNGAANIVNDSANNTNMKAIIEQYAADMEPSSTLVIFVTDHGTGYSDQQGWNGARVATEGPDSNSGKLYNESTFAVNLKYKVWQKSDDFVENGKTFRVWKNLEGKVELWMREGGRWVRKGIDADEDGWITEDEIGENLNADPALENDWGWTVAYLAGKTAGDFVHEDNTWDTDADGTPDVQARWDGTRYVFEKKKADGTWQEIGRDTSGDFIINGTDGGVDWNGDGDKNDKVGFHEGINLWGREVLWDDQLAALLQPLKDKGIHILMEAITCFSGGLVGNLQGIVDDIVTGATEDTKHWARPKPDGTFCDFDQTAFMQNLKGIDFDSFNAAWQKGIEADDAAWTAAGADPFYKNNFLQWTLPLVASESSFHDQDGRVSITLKIPDALAGKVYDFEVIFGHQIPRWDTSTIDADVNSINTFQPFGCRAEKIPGGFRIYSDEPFSQVPQLWDLGYRPGTKKMRIQLTGEDHTALGYISPGLSELPDRDSVLGGSLDPSLNMPAGATTGWLYIGYDGRDLTGGTVPVRRVELYVNGELQRDSGNIRETLYIGQPESIMCGVGDRFTIMLVITNDFGQQLTITKTVTVVGTVVIPCFARDTLVLMADGSTKLISDIRIGDIVWSYDTATGKMVAAEVTGTNCGEADFYYLVNGNLKVTPPHPFYTADGRWVAVEDLKVGDVILGIGGTVEITSIERVATGQSICNICVRGYHNFFVSADGIDFYLVREE